MKYLLKAIHILLLSFGFIALIMTIMAFTSLPYFTRYWLATHESRFNFTPDYIVMLGGSGMPSEDNLIRLYYTAKAANMYENAQVIVAHPLDSAVCLKMKEELQLKSINKSRILFEQNGTNTRSQVLEIQKRYPQVVHAKIIVISSPEQIFRSVESFRKVGFKSVGGYPSFACDMSIDLRFNAKKLKGSKYLPDVGNNLNIRYNFWNYLKIEIVCLREFSAIAYYKMNGWI